MSSPLGATRCEIGRSDEGSICLLFVVVKMSDWRGTDDGIYEDTFSVRSEIDEVDGRENERVEGRERPGNVERRTFTFCGAIFASFKYSDH